MDKKPDMNGTCSMDGKTDKDRKPYWISAEDLANRGKNQIPPELISNTHLIYSSPATLAFNSPGAQGFGVKRAGLAIPGSVMLLVAPGCCGRNTTLLAEMPEYHNRFFYLMMDETDIVTGRHLKNIPQAVEEICQSLPQMPSVVMICLTCADALLGTDMERVCRKAMKKVDIPVLPCYMYALTREGRKPPMVHVRQSIYSLLEPMEKRPGAVNLLGYFAHLIDECEIYDLLHQMGIRKTREISRCRDYAEYKQMAEANFNLVLNPEARFAAQDMQKRLNIPSVELTRLYQLDKIQNQYHIFASALGTTVEDQKYYDAAKEAIDVFGRAYPGTVFSVGEGCNADPFELSLAFLRYGFRVNEIFGTPTADNFVYIKKIAALSPETKIYSNLEPTMLYYDISEGEADVTIGRDAAYYHPGCPNVEWSEDVQPFGYAGVKLLFEQLLAALQGAGKESAV
ncbi:MAG: nitrogenase component 1 [Lachnospiraceae bacterium]|nr:nitrogenase component 1 [Lachnospiraceae bacterium]